jgi:hypothetical protein
MKVSMLHTKRKTLQLLYNPHTIMVSWLVVAVQLIMKSKQPPHQPSQFSSGIRGESDMEMGCGVSTDTSFVHSGRLKPITTMTN